MLSTRPCDRATPGSSSSESNPSAHARIRMNRLLPAGANVAAGGGHEKGLPLRRHWRTVPPMASEIDIKARRLDEFLDRHGIDGVLLTRRDNFSWITCGKDNHIANNTPIGVASILATRDGKRVCLASTIEAPR